MYIGLCLSAIDHDRGNRSEAREQVLKLKERFGLTSVELVLEGIGRRLAPYPWEWTDVQCLPVQVQHWLTQIFP